MDGDLNKTVSAGNNNDNNWNLLDDPAILKEDEEEPGNGNILDFSDKEIKPNSNKLLNMGSSIHFLEKPAVSKVHYGTREVEEDDE